MEQSCRKNGLYYKTKSIGHEECRKFSSFHEAIMVIGRIKSEKKYTELQEASGHEEKSNAIFQSNTKQVDPDENTCGQAHVNQIGWYDLIAERRKALPLQKLYMYKKNKSQYEDQD